MWESVSVEVWGRFACVSLWQYHTRVCVSTGSAGGVSLVLDQSHFSPEASFSEPEDGSHEFEGEMFHSG